MTSDSAEMQAGQIYRFDHTLLVPTYLTPNYPAIYSAELQAGQTYFWHTYTVAEAEDFIERTSTFAF